jgi:RimJ/RimL family protein N-acetyltransferase
MNPVLGLDRPDLATPRLRLRRPTRADAALIHLYASDARVARMTTSIPHPNPPGSAEAFVERVAGPDAREIVWAIDAGAEGENGLIGVISLAPRAEGTAEIGYWIAPAFWNAGYAGEAVEAVTAEAARQGLAALTARVFQDNVAAARVLTRAGFAYVGEDAAFSVARGAMVPTFLYRLEFGAGRGGAA